MSFLEEYEELRGWFAYCAGQSFLGTKVQELCHNPVPGLSEVLIEKIFCCLYSSEAFSKVLALFVDTLPALQPRAVSSLLLTPLLKDFKKEVNCLRCFPLYTGVIYVSGFLGFCLQLVIVPFVLEASITTSILTQVLTFLETIMMLCLYLF